ncbi:hypothetical protein KORDIASMS9_02893 [Kordia sp. SMS9]|uniref:Rossmann-like and DUF2520 domain-containing protein n=1 Tax=Kordia sp. SMS9 TaxID=2282170 RepID=UPI000E0D9BBB|nr:Rossmann-like and DUF2520 domain-containing protein [Kordia sp. SMS9]AXG70650.1 hypothetical protein KORDIASMS9_02893 [Kordia sp. SMS9]
MIKVVILGAGNIAQHLYRVFEATEEIKVVQVYNRSEKALQYFKNVATTTSLKTLLEAAVYIIAVSDDAIASVSNKLPFTDRLVVHTSGSASMHVLHKKNRRGVFYPLQTFTKGKKVDFSTIPLCLEAREKADFTLLQTIATAIGSPSYKISSEQRRALHVSAVFVNNFSNHLYRIAHEICEANHVPFHILHPLIQETANKINTLTPYMAQTGPAKRGDEKTINDHLAKLDTDIHKEIYTLLTQSIAKTYGREKL